MIETHFDISNSHYLINLDFEIYILCILTFINKEDLAQMLESSLSMWEVWGLIPRISNFCFLLFFH